MCMQSRAFHLLINLEPFPCSQKSVSCKAIFEVEFVGDYTIPERFAIAEVAQDFSK